MIFLNKFYAIVFSAIVLSSVFTGCASEDGSSSSSKVQVTTSAESVPEVASSAKVTEIPTNVSIAVTENVTEQTSQTEKTTEKHEFKRENDSFICDEANILSETDIAECNEAIRKLYNDKLLNVAVVTANDLHSMSPNDYAVSAYNDLFSGRGSGMVFLVNNASGNDVLYLHGNCEKYISQDDKNEAFYWGTNEIVSGQYSKAIKRMLALAEKCPDYVFDNAGLFEAVQLQELESDFASGNGSAAFLITSNQTEISNDDLIKEYYSRRFSGKNGVMIMLDLHSKAIIAYSNETVPDAIGEAVKKANESSAKSDFAAAAKTIAEAVK